MSDDGSALDRKARSWSILYFDPQVLAGPADEIVGSEMTIRKPVFDDWRVRRIMVRLYMAEVKRAEAIRRQELLFNLIALVGSRASRGSDLAPPVGRAKAAIDDAPWRGWSLRELAEESGISRFQLIRGFACATGLTPHAYIVQRRIELVRELIRRGVPLADAALQSGFADQSHMTRIFVRKYGFSPGAYARPCFHAGRLCSERSGSRPSPRTT